LVLVDERVELKYARKPLFFMSVFCLGHQCLKNDEQLRLLAGLSF
jgi:hypothetical protein